MSDAWERLLPRLEELTSLYTAIKLLHWDQSVLMPRKGSPARAQTLGDLEAIAHERLTDPAVGELIAELAENGSLDDVRAAHVRVLARDYEKATRVPKELVAAMAEASAIAFQAWTQARERSDFASFRPHLQRVVDLKKQEADALGWQNERYDALLDQFEPDVTAKEIEATFEELVRGLGPLVDAVFGAPKAPPAFLSGDYDEGSQGAFCLWLAERLGFDTDGGRLDISPAHPFTQQISAGDVRQTARTDRASLFDGLYAVLHETGHALYEQGLPQELLGLPAGRVPSLGLHESQSRLWENQVGRSRPFTDWLLPLLKDRFPHELGMVTPEEFHLGVNYPNRSFIRITADELTYNFHIVLRFQLELALFRDELEVDDLPAAFNDTMESQLGIRPDKDSNGVLQDVHWSINLFGYFPTYTLGTLYAAGFYDRAEQDLGGLADDLRRGDCGRLLQWLRDNIHAHAYLRPPKEIAEGALGGPLSSRPFIDYLAAKYSHIYDLSL